jgi:hypothetical protein
VDCDDNGICSTLEFLFLLLLACILFVPGASSLASPPFLIFSSFFLYSIRSFLALVFECLCCSTENTRSLHTLLSPHPTVCARWIGLSIADLHSLFFFTGLWCNEFTCEFFLNSLCFYVYIYISVTDISLYHHKTNK